MKLRTLLPAAMALVSGSAASAQPVVAETFDSALNGWGIYADASQLAWAAGEGNPGGCARARDLNSGVLWGFLAPAAYTGDKSCYYGGTITWEVKVSHTSSAYNNSPDLTLEAPGPVVLIYDFPTAPPANVWAARSVQLVESAWHVGTFNGPAPTPAAFQAALASITALKFACEFSASMDTGRIDNAVLTPAGACPPACDPDFTCDGNADQDDVACLIDATAGNPGCECQDLDFNQDGNVDQDDVAALINVVAGGGCP